MREGSAPNFAPPVEEGVVFTLQDETGELVDLEFLGLIIHNDHRYAFFFDVDEEGQASGVSGDVMILEVTELDEEGQPAGLEVVADEAILEEVYADFREATKDLYTFEA